MSKNHLTILAIETSCDETAMAVIKSKKTASGWPAQGGSALCGDFEIISNVVASQIDIHKKWGGVYPELASRAHLEAMIPVLAEAISPLQQSTKSEIRSTKQARNSNLSNFKHSELDIVSPACTTMRSIAGRNFDIRISNLINTIDAIAVTEKPGLIGSLLMGLETAEILGAYFNKPVIKVNHLEGHIYSAFCAVSQKLKVKSKKFQISNKNNNPEFKINNLKFKIPKTGIFPILALVVSGGHTSLILMRDHLQYQTVAETIDDAAGEAFDKVARILGLGYPGGPEIEKLAKSGNEDAYDLPIGLDGKKDFSFSGLKTSVLYKTKDVKTGKAKKYNKPDMAASFQKIVADTLIQKTKIAFDKHKPQTLVLSGGVSANSYIRERFEDAFSQPTTDNRQPTILIPPKNLSTDNAVGIGIAGTIKKTKRATK